MPITTYEYEGIEFEIDYDFEPEEPATRDCPGADASCILNSVKHAGDEFVDILSSSTLSYIADRIARMVEDGELDRYDHHGDYLVSLHKDGEHE